MRPEGFSIIICVYNGVSRISHTIDHINRLNSNTLPVEVIVVDNRSTDGSDKVVRETWDPSSIAASLKIIREEKPGKAHAWRKGLDNAVYSYILLCDDDNWLAPNYLEVGLDILRTDPSIAVLSGRSEGVFDGPIPDWFKKRSTSWAIGDQYDSSGDVTHKHQKLWGAGSFYRMEFLEMLYGNGFTHLFDGLKKQGMAEDHELCLAIKHIGGKLYYSDQLFFRHQMPAKRINWAAYLELVRNSALNSYRFDPYQKINNPSSGIKNRIKLSVWFELFESLKRIMGSGNIFKYYFSDPVEDAEREWIIAYKERFRLKGLLGVITVYSKLLKKVRDAPWSKMRI